MPSPQLPIFHELSEGLSCPYPAIPPPVNVELVMLPAHDCSYLPGRLAEHRAIYADRLSPQMYHDFMDAGFRRSGKVIYQPVCRGCRQCLPIRVLPAEFMANKSQRRCRRRNADLSISAGPPRSTDEKFDLYRRYLTQWHATDAGDRESFEAFLYASPVDSIEFTYRDSGKLVGVGICDISPRFLSSVYFYFDPDQARRGLGTFGALHEIAAARDRHIPYYYLGYWVGGCQAMSYKADYGVHEILYPDGLSRRSTAAVDMGDFH